MVVHGAGGLDEFAPAGSTFVAELANGGVRTHDLRPADFGLDESDPVGLRGGEPADNARIALEILRGGGPEAAAQRHADDRRRGALRGRGGDRSARRHGDRARRC